MQGPLSEQESGGVRSLFGHFLLIWILLKRGLAIPKSSGGGQKFPNLKWNFFLQFKLVPSKSATLASQRPSRPSEEGSFREFGKADPCVFHSGRLPFYGPGVCAFSEWGLMNVPACWPTCGAARAACFRAQDRVCKASGRVRGLRRAFPSGEVAFSGFLRTSPNSVVHSGSPGPRVASTRRKEKRV